MRYCGAGNDRSQVSSRSMQRLHLTKDHLLCACRFFILVSDEELSQDWDDGICADRLLTLGNKKTTVSANVDAFQWAPPIPIN